MSTNKYWIKIRHKKKGTLDWIIIFAENEEDALKKANYRLLQYEHPTNSEILFWGHEICNYLKAKYKGYIADSVIQVRYNYDKLDDYEYCHMREREKT